MVLASHDTMTYLTPKKWWWRPLFFTAQCQSKDLKEQVDLGIGMFDLRIVFENGVPYFAHGPITYKFGANNYDCSIMAVLEFLDNTSKRRIQNGQEPLYVRIMCERNENHDLFAKLCSHIEESYNNIVFWGGRDKIKWNIVYDFKTSLPRKIADKYSSSNNDTSKKTGYYYDDIFPRIYAILNNKKWRKHFECQDVFYLHDFIGVY